MAYHNKTLEKVIVKEVRSYLIKNDFYFHNNQAGMGSEPGIPDMECCIRGQYLALEFKRPVGGVQSLAQKKHQERIEKNGGIYLLVNDPKIAIDEIERILKNEVK